MNSTDQRSSMDSMYQRGSMDSMDSMNRSRSNISSVIIGIVCNSLDPAIRKINRVRSSHNTSAIIGFRLLEVGIGVIISNSICVCVRRWLSQVRGSITSLGNNNRGSILGSSSGRGHKNKGKEGLHALLLNSL